MTNLIPCGLEDDRVRFEPDPVEPESVMTDMEKRLSWICDSWKDALELDSSDEWHDLRMQLYGASQTLIHCSNRREDALAITFLGSLAFENTLECIRGGRYER